MLKRQVQILANKTLSPLQGMTKFKWGNIWKYAFLEKYKMSPLEKVTTQSWATLLLNTCDQKAVAAPDSPTSLSHQFVWELIKIKLKKK